MRFPLLKRDLAAYALLILLIPLCIAGSRIGVDNRMELWMAGNSQTRLEYKEFQDHFGSDAFILVGYSGEGLFDATKLDVQMRVAEDLESLPGVEHVLGIPTLFNELYGGENPEALQEEILGSPFYRNFLVSEDGKSAALLVEMSSNLETAAASDLLRNIRSHARSLDAAGFDLHIVGPPVLNVALNEASTQDAGRTFPIAALFSILILWFFTRSVWATLIAATCAALAVAATLGLMEMHHYRLNMVTGVMPALLWVLALANLIHLIHAYEQALTEGASPLLAAAVAVGRTARPCVIAASTTAAGFFSLMTASMGPVRELGGFAGAGMLLVLAVTLLLAPLLLRWMPARVRSREAIFLKWNVVPWTQFIVRRRRLIIGAWLLGTVVCLCMLPLLRVSSNPLDFLPPDSATLRDYEHVSSRLTGVYSLEVVLNLDRPWTDPHVWPVIEKLSAGLGAQPGVARILSPLDLLRQLRRWHEDMGTDSYALPAGQEEAKALLSEQGPAGSRWMQRLVAPSGQQVRLSVLIRDLDGLRFLAIVKQTQALIAALPGGVQGNVTGLVLQLVQTQMALVWAQLYGLGAALLTIYCCMAIGLRSIRLAALALLPNVLPLATLIPLMVQLGFTLDPATIMVASIALGIAVDDTAHLLARFTGLVQEGVQQQAAVSGALSEVGWPMIAATGMACAGFLALLHSGFRPIAWFGGMSAGAMLVALAAELTLTPALLLSLPLKRHQHAA